MQLRGCVVVAGLALLACKKKESAPASQPSTGVVAPRGDQGQMNAPPTVSANPPPPGDAPPLRAAVDAGAAAATATVPAGSAAPLATGDGGAAKATAPDDNGGFGGLGQSGTGVGSGEPGIGIGHIGGKPGGGVVYGTIGHGSGTANPCGGALSYGTIGRKSPPPPSQRPGVRTGALELQDDPALPKELVKRYLRRSLSKLEYCYEKQLLVTPTLHGTLNLAFTIGPSGAVTEVKASGFPSPEVSSCVEGYVKGIEFPKPTKGSLIVKRYPLTFVTSQ